MENKKTQSQIILDMRSILESCKPSLNKAINDLKSKYPKAKIDFRLWYDDKNSEYRVSFTLDSNSVLND